MEYLNLIINIIGCGIIFVCIPWMLVGIVGVSEKFTKTKNVKDKIYAFVVMIIANIVFFSFAICEYEKVMYATITSDNIENVIKIRIIIDIIMFIIGYAIIPTLFEKTYSKKK